MDMGEMGEMGEDFQEMLHKSVVEMEQAVSDLDDKGKPATAPRTYGEGDTPLNVYRPMDSKVKSLFFNFFNS